MFMIPLKFSLIAVLCLWLPAMFLQWHDWQRVGEIALICLASVSLLCGRPALNTRNTAPVGLLWAFAAWLAWGLMSAVLATRPAFALAEVALFAGLMVFAYAAAGDMARSSRQTTRALIVLSMCVSFVLVVRMFTVMLAALAGGERPDPTLVSGFTNPRFLGQLCSFLIPLLAVPLTQTSGPSRPIRSAAWALLTGLWVLSLFSGARGGLLGLACAALVLMCLNHRCRRWVRVQGVAAIVGLSVFFTLHVCLPWALRVADTAGPDLFRSGLTGRAYLWDVAVQHVLSHPFFGVGPMHYSHDINAAGAHPHQAVLQVAAEWGLPVAALLLALLGLGLTVFIRRVRHDVSDDEFGPVRIALLAAFLAATVQGMVDGLAVVPYTQIWYALVLGSLCALCMRSGTSPGTLGWPRFIGAVSAVSVLYLSVFAAHTFPCVASSSEHYLVEHGGILRPRFWSQGFMGSDMYPPDGVCPETVPAR